MYGKDGANGSVKAKGNRLIEHEQILICSCSDSVLLICSLLPRSRSRASHTAHPLPCPKNNRFSDCHPARVFSFLSQNPPTPPNFDRQIGVLYTCHVRYLREVKMNGRNKKRNLEQTIVCVKEAVLQAQLFSASKATSHYVARRCGITPAYANRLLLKLWASGELAYKSEAYKNTWRRLWVTASYAKRHKQFVMERDVPKQMELWQ